MGEDESAIESFFSALLDDKTEQQILKMVSQGRTPEEILEILLSKKGGL